MKDKPSNEHDLSQQIAELDWDSQPRRDLWPDISSKIRFANNKTKHRNTRKSYWIPTAIAASLVLAIGSVMFSSMLYQQNQDQQNLADQKYQSAMALYQQAQLQLIEQQHQMVRFQFAGLLQNQRENLDPDFLAEAENLIENIDFAAAEIKNAISTQPNNPNYTSMLVRTYQQELKLLNKVRTKQALSI